MNVKQLWICSISIVMLLVSSGCAEKKPWQSVVSVQRCNTPIVMKPVINYDVNVSSSVLLRNLIENYAKMTDYADKLEKANEVCR